MPVTRPALLIVDDEPGVVRAMRRLFRRAGYRVILAHSGAEALTALENEQGIGVVVSDQNMPEMSGTELFGKMRKRFPDPMRILLTGRPDFDAVVDAINHGAIYKFLIKPWCNEDLLATVGQALSHYTLASENRRLLHELGDANDQLKQLNAGLEERVRQKAEELLKAVSYDAVTGLPNRVLIADRIAQAIKHAQRSGARVGVLLFDIDSFKLVNESFGHAAGDELLRQVAARVSACIRSGDTVGRIHSDDFCVVIGDADSAEQPAKAAQRILDAMAAPFPADDHEIMLTANIGLSVYPDDGSDGETLLHHAEAALHDAKDRGRHGYRYYSRDLNRCAAQKLAMQAALRRALDRAEFCLHYQARAGTLAGNITGAEALLRWQHPHRGLLAPCEFVPLLEETGLIEPVGAWALQCACALRRRLRKCGHPLPIAVNLSARQLRQGTFIDTFRGIVTAGGPDFRDAPELEITESAIMQDASLAQRTLKELHDLGVRIAVDDFGTGYSSLSYLIRFPIHCIKIDRSFVTEIVDNPEAKAIVQAIVAMAHSLGLTLIAEGIETPAQLRAVAALGCEEFQGYLLSRPLPESEFMQLVHDGPPPLLRIEGEEKETSRQDRPRLQQCNPGS